MCSYCGCDSIEVIGRFMNEHVEIINATGDLRRALGAQDATGVGAACAHLFGLLFGHTSTEEVGLFTVMKREAELAPHIDTLCREHGDLDVMLRDHIDKEDNSLFPAAAIWLGGDEWVEVNALTHDHDHASGTPHQHAH